MIRSRNVALVLAAVLLFTGATLLIGALLDRSLPPFSPGVDRLRMLSICVAPPALLFAVVLLARLELDAGPSGMAKGELDLLVKHKSQGHLLICSRRAHPATARPQTSVPDTRLTTKPKPAWVLKTDARIPDTRLTTKPKPAPVRETPLDRLLRAKREALCLAAR
jgi:hypothetical protein